MCKLLTVFIFLFVFTTSWAQEIVYVQIDDSFKGKKVRMLGYDDLDRVMLMNGFKGEKWKDIIFRINKLTPAKLKRIKKPRYIYLPDKDKVEEAEDKSYRKNTNYIITSFARIHVKGFDDLNSKFDLTTWKLGLMTMRGYRYISFRLGGALNNYLSVDHKSDFGTQKTSGLNTYFDLFIGLSKPFGKNNFILQYDNLNYLLNKEDQAAVSLEPTRVHRLSFSDTYLLPKDFFILGSVGLFPGFSSNTSGTEFGAGLGKTFASKYSLSASYVQNNLRLEGIKNESKAVSLALSFQL